MITNLKWKARVSVVVALCLIFVSLELPAMARVADPALRIAVAGGSEKAGPRRDSEVAVKVWSEDIPAAGAVVTFTLPEAGPGGRFSDGSRRLTVQADAEGYAHSGTIRSNGISGPFQVAVAAALANATAQATVNAQTAPAGQTPAPEPEPPPSKRSRLKWLLIGAAAVGAVAAAILLTRKDKSEPVVTIGGPIVGSPQ